MTEFLDSEVKVNLKQKKARQRRTLKSRYGIIILVSVVKLFCSFSSKKSPNRDEIPYTMTLVMDKTPSSRISNKLSPTKNSSTFLAASRPSAIAQTTKD